MAARLYSNENFHRLVVGALRELRHDVLTSLETGRSNRRIPDDEVLQLAASEGRAVLTFNRLHFIRLHALHALGELDEPREQLAA